MTSEHLRRAARAATWAAVVLLGACITENDDPVTEVSEPDSVEARPLSMSSALLGWIGGSSVTGNPLRFEVERRSGFDGPWEQIPEGDLPAASGERYTFVDNGLEPATFYGYRVRAVDQIGERSEWSPVKGVLTAPRPGIQVVTRSSGTTTDPDGYLLTLTSGVPGDSVRRLSVGPRAQVIFQPLAPGAYELTLSGVYEFCRFASDTTQQVDVTDLGLETVDTVRFEATCRDPSRASLEVRVATSGTGTNEAPLSVLLEGIIGDSAVTLRRGLTTDAVLFDNLLPGSYQATLEGVASNCTPLGGTTRELTLLAGQEAAETFRLECSRPGQDTTRAGYRLRGRWSAVTGGVTTYTLSLDMSTFDDPAIPGADDVAVVSGTTTFGGLLAAGLTFTDAANVSGSRLQNQGANQVIGGSSPEVAWLNFNTDATRATGNVGIIQLRFAVAPGAAGLVQPATAFSGVDDVQSANGTDLKPNIVIIDADLTVGGGGGGGTPPTARANGPYTAAAGASITFSSAGSVAAPGRTIVGYSWAFSDGQTLPGQSPARSFATAGAYTVTLTVTDDQGATDTDQASITITGGTPPPGNQYVLRGTWGGSGAARTYTLTFDLTGRDDPAIPGLDDVLVISGTTRFAGLTAAGMSYTGSSNVPGSRLQNQGSNNVTIPGVTPSGATDIAWLNFNTDVERATGSVGVVTINFSGAPSGTVTPSTSFGPTDDVQSSNGVNLLPNTRLEEAVLGGGGGGGSAPPTAEANGPYAGQAGAQVSFSSAGSTAAAGRTIVAWSWVFSDGQTLTGPSPSRSFAAAGAFTVTLTVTDDLGATGTDQATINITAPPASGPAWLNQFGTPDANNIVTLSVTLDLRNDLPQTPGPEALARVLVDSLTWNPAVLQYRGFSVPSGNGYTVIVNSAAGRLAITRGDVAPVNSTGLVPIIEVRFFVQGTPGASTTTRTGIGQLQGTAAVNNFDYKPLTTVTEGTFRVP